MRFVAADEGDGSLVEAAIDDVAIIATSSTSAVGDGDLQVAMVPVLGQNVPNPFNPSTEISFNLPQDGRASLKVFDVKGALVRVLLDGELAAGTAAGRLGRLGRRRPAGGFGRLLLPPGDGRRRAGQAHVADQVARTGRIAVTDEDPGQTCPGSFFMPEISTLLSPTETGSMIPCSKDEQTHSGPPARIPWSASGNPDSSPWSGALQPVRLGLFTRGFCRRNRDSPGPDPGAAGPVRGPVGQPRRVWRTSSCCRNWVIFSGSTGWPSRTP